MSNSKHDIKFDCADAESPKISEELARTTEEVRMAKLPTILNELHALHHPSDWFEIVRWDPANQVVVRLTRQDPANVRGTKLLQLEGALKKIIDPGIEIYLESKEDINALRKFRGVQIAK